VPEVCGWRVRDAQAHCEVGASSAACSRTPLTCDVRSRECVPEEAVVTLVTFATGRGGTRGLTVMTAPDRFVCRPGAPMSLVGGSAPTDQGFVRRSAQPPVPLGGPPEPHQRRGLGVTLRARFSAAGDPPLAQKKGCPRLPASPEQMTADTLSASRRWPPRAPELLTDAGQSGSRWPPISATLLDDLSPELKP